jgi:hypothetical protein
MEQVRGFSGGGPRAAQAGSEEAATPLPDPKAVAKKTMAAMGPGSLGSGRSEASGVVVYV